MTRCVVLIPDQLMRGRPTKGILSWQSRSLFVSMLGLWLKSPVGRPPFCRMSGDPQVYFRMKNPGCAWRPMSAPGIWISYACTCKTIYHHHSAHMAYGVLPSVWAVCHLRSLSYTGTVATSLIQQQSPYYIVFESLEKIFIFIFRLYCHRTVTNPTRVERTSYNIIIDTLS